MNWKNLFIAIGLVLGVPAFILFLYSLIGFEGVALILLLLPLFLLTLAIYMILNIMD